MPDSTHAVYKWRLRNRQKLWRWPDSGDTRVDHRDELARPTGVSPGPIRRPNRMTSRLRWSVDAVVQAISRTRNVLVGVGPRSTCAAFSITRNRRGTVAKGNTGTSRMPRRDAVVMRPVRRSLDATALSRSEHPTPAMRSLARPGEVRTRTQSMSARMQRFRRPQPGRGRSGRRPRSFACVSTLFVGQVTEADHA